MSRDQKNYENERAVLIKKEILKEKKSVLESEAISELA